TASPSIKSLWQTPLAIATESSISRPLPSTIAVTRGVGIGDLGMRGRRRYAWSSLLLAALAVCAGGCFSGNPSYFPYLLPPGDIQQTHAKPPGNGPYVNFDPYACRLEVRPQDTSHPVGGNHVVIATVYDASGAARRERRVEWMLEGAGQIVEVDESGCGQGR